MRLAIGDFRFRELSIAVAMLTSTVPLSAQTESVQIEATRITDKLYMLAGRGGNIGLSIGSDGIFLIDDQYAPLTEQIIAAIKAVTDQPVKFVVNTHWHGDHTGGNENLGRTGAIIVAHENVRERMTTEQFTTPAQARDYAAAHLFLGSRTYVIDPDFGGEMNVTIAIGLDDAAIFGSFFKSILGRSLVANVTMRREPLN